MFLVIIYGIQVFLHPLDLSSFIKLGCNCINGPKRMVNWTLNLSACVAEIDMSLQVFEVH